MKKHLIDYEPKEIEHELKYAELHKVLAYTLFCGIILTSLWAVLTDNINEKQEVQLHIQQEVFEQTLEQYTRQMDTINWYNEMGVRMEFSQ